MKKTLLTPFALILILCCCTALLFACDFSSNYPGQQPSCTHSYSVIDKKATCTSGGYTTYKCTLCSESYQEYESALGHTTNDGTCSRCGKSFEQKLWEISFYVDEFKNPTDEAFIGNLDMFVGVFSNSATTDSKLYARILIDSENLAIKLWEYGNYEVKAYSTTYYDITILDENGTKYYTTGTMYKNGERIYLKDWTLITLLQNNQKLKIYITEDSKYGYNATYLFEIQRANFNNVYSDFLNNYGN